MVALKKIFSFPNPVNEIASRLVAGFVVVYALFLLSFHNILLYIPLIYGFLARVLTGPTLSPVGFFASKVVASRIAQPKLVPGPPKRFAQLIGLAFSSSSFVLVLLGFRLAGFIVLAMLAFAASLEAIFGLCLGCKIFSYLMRYGVIPARVCESCSIANHSSFSGT